MTETVRWGEFAKAEPELAEYGVGRLTAAPAYLATVRKSGVPRVHPVSPIFTPDGLFLFMEPTSPKARDLEQRGWFALHNGVPDDEGTGGELWLSGRGGLIDDDGLRSEVAASASYDPAARYILFELAVQEVRCNGYGDAQLPETKSWNLSP